MYHGWCYDESGACTDMPFEPANTALKRHVHLAGYPVQEMGGLLFAYLGPLPAPVLPPWELFVLPNALRQIGHSVLDCNWLQCQENASDPTHVVYTHGYFGEYIHEERGGQDMGYERLLDPADQVGFSHVISEMDDFGLQKACVYSRELGAAKDDTKWHSSTIFPNYVRASGPRLARQEYQIRVPIDDEHTWHILYEVYMAPPAVEVEPQDVIPSFEVPIRDEYGAEICDYICSQDSVAWWSQGAIADRTRENLGVADSAIIHMRNLLDEQISLVESGLDPLNVFRTEEEVPAILRSPPLVGDWDNIRGSIVTPDLTTNGDRYGLINKQVEELWVRIQAYNAAVPS
jgi:5,5'-dehydrodivanillate O-demethylase oxygenase subunit